MNSLTIPEAANPNCSDFDLLRIAVDLSRNEQIGSLKNLRSRLCSLGHASDAIERAIALWASYVQNRKEP